MKPAVFSQPGALVPLLMSLLALAVVIGHIAAVGPARETDEGAAAHVFQLLIAAQAPIIAYVAITGVRRARRQAVAVLVVQLLAVATALTPVWYFGL